MKNSNKGITLLALIITIIVMMILAGVSLSMLFGEEGIVTRAREASREYQRQAELERVIAEIQFMPNTVGKRMKPETVMKLAEYIVDDGFKMEQLTVFYKWASTEEIICYKYAEIDENGNEKIITPEERKKMEKKGIYLLKGDANADGLIDEKDYNIIRDIAGWVIKDIDEYNLEVCDVNGDGMVAVGDPGTIYRYIKGGISEEEIMIKDNIKREDINEKLSDIKMICMNYYFGSENDTADMANSNEYFKNMVKIHKDEKTQTEHVVYIYNELLTKDLGTYLENNVDEYKTKGTEIESGYFVGVKMLKGDANLDGTFTLDDINLIEKNIEEDIDFTSVQTTIIDMDNNDKIDEQDVERLKKVLNGEAPMYPEWAE